MSLVDTASRFDRSSSADSVPVVLLSLDVVYCAVEISRVIQIEEVVSEDGWSNTAEAASSIENLIDLVDYWQLPHNIMPRLRRVILIRTAKGQRRLSLGEKVTVLTLPSSRLIPIPLFLEGWARRLGIKAFFAADNYMGFLLEVDWLDQCSLMEDVDTNSHIDGATIGE